MPKSHAIIFKNYCRMTLTLPYYLHLFLASFMLDASRYNLELPPQTITIQLGELAAAEGRSTKTDTGWVITIDSVYYQQFQNRPSILKKLFYHELAHIYLNLSDSEGNNIMNSQNIYTRLREKDLRFLFNNQYTRTEPSQILTSQHTPDCNHANTAPCF